MERGQKAETVSEFVDEIVRDTKARVLSALLDDNCDITQTRADYKTAVALSQRMKNVIEIGKFAERKLAELEEE